MAIRVAESADRNGIIHRSEGTITYAQLLEAVEAIRSLSEGGKRWVFVLGDFMEVDQVECSAEQIRTLARMERMLLASALVTGSVVALAAGQDYQFGLGRMWQAYAEETDWEIAVFHSLKDAEEWIRERVRGKFAIEVQYQLPTTSGGSDSRVLTSGEKQAC